MITKSLVQTDPTAMPQKKEKSGEQGFIITFQIQNIPTEEHPQIPRYCYRTHQIQHIPGFYQIHLKLNDYKEKSTGSCRIPSPVATSLSFPSLPLQERQLLVGGATGGLLLLLCERVPGTCCE